MIPIVICVFSNALTAKDTNSATLSTPRKNLAEILNRVSPQNKTCRRVATTKVIHTTLAYRRTGYLLDEGGCLHLGQLRNVLTRFASMRIV